MSSKLGVVPELMLETNELNRMAKFVSDDISNNIKNSSARFGVIRNIKTDPDFNNFKIITGGSSDTISLSNESIAVDKDGLYLRQQPFTDVNIPVTNGIPYHIIISHQYTHVETGTVSITVDGVMTGVGTEFTKVLRGQPHFPTKIKFYNSVNGNNGEYTVVEVGGNTNVLIAGAFNAESGMKYSVIGTFSTTAVIPSDDKEIYYYDSCLLRIIPDATYQAMTLIAGKEFRIATALNTAGTVQVKDYRSDEGNSVIFTSSDMDFVDSTANVHVLNPIIGIESIKWDSRFSTKDKNEVSVSWGFRSKTWTTEPSARKVTITDGSGGKYKTSGQFATGDFNGWRLYNSRGDYSRIISSVKSSTSINLIVEALNIDYLIPGDQILIVPDVEEVIIVVSPDVDGDVPSTPLVANRYAFTVNTDVAKIYLLVPSRSNYKYHFEYLYKRFNRYSKPSVFPNDPIGYYNETSFTDTGLLKSNPVDRTRYPFVSSVDGYILLIPNPNSYDVVVSRVDTGDSVGVNQLAIRQVLFNPTLKLYVGTDLQYQYYVGTTFAMTANSYIELMTTRSDGSSLRDGNYFMLHFNQPITDAGGTVKLKIVQDYANSLSFTLLHEFSQDDLKFINSGSPEGIWIRCTYHIDTVTPANTKWIISFTNETSVTQMKEDIEVLKNSVLAVVPRGVTVDFPSSDPAKTPAGWVMLLGQAVNRVGTYAGLFALFGIDFGSGDGVATFNLPDTRKRVVLGYDPAGTLNSTAISKDDENYGKVGNKGGERTHVLTTPEMPSHTHAIETGQNVYEPGGYVPRADGSFLHNSPQATLASGGGLSHENRQPYIVMCKLMRY